MSLEAYRAVWQHTEQNGSRLVVLLALAEHANDKGFCWPGMARIAQYANISERSARRHVGGLEAAGEIEVKRGDGRGNTSVYYLTAIEKGDSSVGVSEGKATLNGDSPDRVSEQERGTDLSERGTPVSEKGDTSVPRTVRNRKEPEELHPRAPAPETRLEKEAAAHPAFNTWLDVTEQWPGFTRMRKLVIPRLGDEPNRDALDAAWRGWLGRGYSLQNVEGILDWYDKARNGQLDNYEEETAWAPL